jgi:hypothetical protein
MAEKKQGGQAIGEISMVTLADSRWSAFGAETKTIKSFLMDKTK